jgi:hypothetical protein
MTCVPRRPHRRRPTWQGDTREEGPRYKDLCTKKASEIKTFAPRRPQRRRPARREGPRDKYMCAEKIPKTKVS